MVTGCTAISAGISGNGDPTRESPTALYPGNDRWNSKGKDGGVGKWIRRPRAPGRYADIDNAVIEQGNTVMENGVLR